VHHGHVAATVLHAQQQDKEQNKNQANKSKLKSKKTKNKSNNNSKEKSKNKSKKSKIKFSSKSKIKNQLKKPWFSLIVIKIRCSGNIEFSSYDGRFLYNKCLSESRTNRRTIAMQGFTIADAEIHMSFHNS
jgi:hypothetical protein